MIIKSRIVFIGLVLAALTGSAQHKAVTDRLLNQSGEPARVVPPGSVSPASATHSVSGFEDCELDLQHRYTSLTGYHYFYRQVYQGLPVYGAYLKVNTDHAGRIISSYHTLVHTGELKIEAPAADQQYWVVNENRLLAAQAGSEGSFFTLSRPDGSLLYSQDQRLYYTDTMVKGMVFNPDPLTTAGVVYGQNGTWRNFNDSDYALLNDQRVLKSFPATLQNDTFYLANRYCRIKDIDSPFFPATTSTNGEFNYTRSQSGFKEVMALYHIYALQLYVQGLGFNEVNYQLKVDPHAGYADQSYFSHSEGDTILRFGIGGVPDAEDADVIVHEYTHAISFSLSPEGVESNDRKAIEEGSCDAMACAYSRKLSTYRWRTIFTWDGYNEFWNGRDGSSSKTYENRIGSYYSDSEIWSSAMNNLMEVLGEDVVIRLLLASFPQFTRTTSMPQAARIMYETDSIINNKVNQGYLALEFNYRKFDSFPVGLNDVAFDRHFSITNTLAFAQGSGNAVLSLKQGGSMTVEVCDLNGRIVERLSGNQVMFDPAGFAPGIYILNVRSANASGYFKLARY